MVAMAARGQKGSKVPSPGAKVGDRERKSEVRGRRSGILGAWRWPGAVFFDIGVKAKAETLKAEN